VAAGDEEAGGGVWTPSLASAAYTIPDATIRIEAAHAIKERFMCFFLMIQD
jgi:hypothetical protein